MKTLSFEKDTPYADALRMAFVMTFAYILLIAPETALAQTSGGFQLKGLDDVMCNIYIYLSKKVLFYVALIVAIVAILAYLLKMSKEVWGVLFVIALLIGIAQGIAKILSTLGSFDVQCAGIN